MSRAAQPASPARDAAATRRAPRVRTGTDTLAILTATTPATEGGAAATLSLGPTTVLGRMVEQLEALDVGRIVVLTRPAWQAEVERAVAGAARAAVSVLATDDLADDLRAVAEIAGETEGSVLVARGDAVTQLEALAGLFADPRIVSGIVVSAATSKSSWSFRALSARGRVISASSPYHRIRQPGVFFLGMLKVDARDRAALAAAAARLAGLVDPAPERWQAELERKAVDWRLGLWLAERRADGEEAPERPADPETWATLPLGPEAERLLEQRIRTVREDAVSLLLVGLVRADVQLAPRRMRGFYYGRPVSPEAVARAEAELAEIDEDKIALDSAVKGADGFFTTFFVSPYSRYIARFAARRGWTPNQVTTVSMIIGALAAAAFATGSRPGLIAGAILLQAAFTADCVDGQLARYTRQFSKLGAWLDSVFDRGKEYLVFAGLALGSTRGFGEDVWALAAAAMTLQTARHYVDFAYGATQRHKITTRPQQPLEQPEDVPPRSVAALEAGSYDVTDTAVEAPGDGVEADDEAPVARRTLKSRVRRAVRRMSRLDRWRATYWARRMLVLPIGERFALVSITAALFSPRVTFLALLIWGGGAAAYAVVGRGLRSLVR